MYSTIVTNNNNSQTQQLDNKTIGNKKPFFHPPYPPPLPQNRNLVQNANIPITSYYQNCVTIIDLPNIRTNPCIFVYVILCKIPNK